MAVLESSTASVTPATGSSFTISITVPATSPALVVHVALSSTTATVSSVAWSLGGSASQITSTRNSDAFISIWCLPAPASGTGTITVTLSASVPFQSFATTFTGADQTTPCPLADAVTGVSNVIGSHTLTPTNLTANDATSAAGSNTVAGNPLSVTPNQRYVNSTTAVNLLGGDATGTTGVTLNWDSGGGFGAFAAVRIVAAAASGRTISAADTIANFTDAAAFTNTDHIHAASSLAPFVESAILVNVDHIVTADTLGRFTSAAAFHNSVGASNTQRVTRQARKQNQPMGFE